MIGDRRRHFLQPNFIVMISNGVQRMKMMLCERAIDISELGGWHIARRDNGPFLSSESQLHSFKQRIAAVLLHDIGVAESVVSNGRGNSQLTFPQVLFALYIPVSLR